MSYLSPTLSMLMAAVKKVASSMSRDFSEIEKLQSSVKGHREFVLSSIKRAESTLRVELSKARPTFAFAEDGKKRPEGSFFVVSPLDGVLNFSHGIPYFSISVAVCENGILTAAVVYNPAADELYFAEKGNGAYKEGFRNHERLRVSSRKDLSESILSIRLDDKDGDAAIGNKIVSAAGAVRTFGAFSLELAYVAAGKLDSAIGMNKSLSEIAAGILLVKEAGGNILDAHQKDIRSEDLDAVWASGNVVAGNPEINKKVYELLNK